MRFRASIPTLHIDNEATAKAFYVDFLGFDIDWEHRYADNFPLYMQISMDDCVIHLSEHKGDCSPGGAVRIETTEIENYHGELLGKDFKDAPALKIEATPWKSRDMSVQDPFGNRLTFWSPILD